jgi:hypothetical protein
VPFLLEAIGWLLLYSYWFGHGYLFTFVNQSEEMVYVTLVRMLVSRLVAVVRIETLTRTFSTAVEVSLDVCFVDFNNFCPMRDGGDITCLRPEISD